MCSISETNLRNQKGMILITFIILLSVLSVFLLIAGKYLWINSRVLAQKNMREQAFYLAGSGLDYAIANACSQSNWNWSKKISYHNGTFTVNVSEVSGDTVHVNSMGQVATMIRIQSLLLKVVDYLGFSVFIKGSVENIGFDDPARIRVNSNTLMDMDLASLLETAMAQDNYYKNNLIVDEDFFEENQEATRYNNGFLPVYYIEKNFIGKKNIGDLVGIFVVMGDAILKGCGNLYGVFYFPESGKRHKMSSRSPFDIIQIYGGVFGDVDIVGKNGINGKTINIYYNKNILERFFKFSDGGSPQMVERLRWMAN